jgi:hypothetical protein
LPWLKKGGITVLNAAPFREGRTGSGLVAAGTANIRHDGSLVPISTMANSKNLSSGHWQMHNVPHHHLTPGCQPGRK